MTSRGIGVALGITIYSASLLRCKASIRPIDNQLFDWTTFVLKVITVHSNELIFGQGIPLTLTIYVAHLT